MFRSELKSFLTVALMIAAITLFSVEIQAQKKKTSSTRKAKPVASPTPPSGEPVVVSRADEFRGIDSANLEPVGTPRRTDGEQTTQTADSDSKTIAELSARIKNLENGRHEKYDEKQKRLLLNLDILTKAEQRSESLRKQRFELIEKQFSIQIKLDQIENDGRPEAIERTVSMAGSLRPEEIREARRKNLESEKRNLQALLTEIQATRTTLEQTVQRADAMVEKLRLKLEKEIDDALSEDEDEKP